MYSTAVFTLNTLDLCSFSSLSFPFFHRVNHRSPPVGAKGKEPKRPAQVSKLAYLATLVVKNSSKLGFNSLAQAFASRSRLLLVSYYVTSLIRLLLAACICRSNLGNKRTRSTHYRHRMAHTLKHFCSYSSIGTDTCCCSTPCRFVLGITLVREIYYPHVLGWTRRNAGGGTVGADRRVCPMSRFCHLDGAPATRDLSLSVEMTWSAPRRSSLNVNCR